MTAPQPMLLSDSVVKVIPGDPDNLDGWGFKWPVTFEVTPPESVPGWIVQHVTIRFRTWTAPGVFHYDKIMLAGDTLHDKPVESYWEAWPVPAGKSLAYWPAKGRLAASIAEALFPDEYLVVPDDELGEDKSRGEVKVVGTVAFYVGQLPETFNQQRATSAGVLPSMSTRPDFWTGEGMPHHLVATWNSLTKNGLQRLQMVPAPDGESFKPKNVDWSAW